MRLNQKPAARRTYEGAKASGISPIEQLRRAVLSCMLWEKQFYESGEAIAERIEKLCDKVHIKELAELAIKARTEYKLRHAPSLLLCGLLRHPNKYLLGDKISNIIAQVIQRADELTELLAIYWKDGKKPIAAQLKKGLALAFRKFNEYQLAKYNRPAAIKLGDVLKLVRPRPDSDEQSELWRRLLNNELKTPDTWEVALSSGGDKKTHWERLLREKKLGELALLRNMRNFIQSDVDSDLVKRRLSDMRTDRILPFRFIASANHAPSFESEIEQAMLKSLSEMPKIGGRTVLLIDMSGSMSHALSGKSDLNRIDAACALAILLREICEDVRIYTFSLKLCEIPARHGFALKDAIKNSQSMQGTPLGLAIKSIYAAKDFHQDTFTFNMYHRNIPVEYRGQNLKPDRLIIFTDEQSHDEVGAPQSQAYMINIASYDKGVAYGQYHHINGFSEAVIDYIREFEKADLQ